MAERKPGNIRKPTVAGAVAALVGILAVVSRDALGYEFGSELQAGLTTVGVFLAARLTQEKEG